MQSPGVKNRVADFLLVLKQLPGQIWILLVLHMLDGFSYFAISTNLTIYLTTNFDVDDVTAGVYYGIWGALLVAFGIPTGFLIDRLGIKTSMIVGAVFNAISRTIFALSDNLEIALFALFIGTTIGAGFFISVLHVALNRYTESAATRSVVSPRPRLRRRNASSSARSSTTLAKLARRSCCSATRAKPRRSAR